jgi:hypothetical protein
VFKDSGQPAFMGSTTDKTPIIENMENIELKEHVVMSDPFTREFCIDCSYPVNEKGRVTYPTTNVNMLSFAWGGTFDILDDALVIQENPGAD